MSPEKKGVEKVTLGDVGRHCGVHRTTVGLALRNHPSIPEATRDRIQSAARELGYRPDPALASLVAYRHRKAGAQFHSTVAVVSDSDYGVKFWRTSNHVGMEQFQGLSEQADEMGFRLEEYSVGTDRHHCARVNSILKARGITAVIITGLANIGDPVALEWDNFSCISMSYSLPQPRIPRITTQHRANAFLAVTKLIELGYRRIGFATTLENDTRVDHAWTAGYLSACYHAGASLSHYSIYMPHQHGAVELADAPLVEWIRRDGIQAILCTQQHVLRYLENCGLAVPQTVGFAGIDLSTDPTRISGVNQNSKEIGKQAIRVIASLQANNQKGIPSFQQVHLVRGVWHAGSTLSRQVIL